VISCGMTAAADSLPEDVATLQAMLLTERAARLAAESEAKLRALQIEQLKYTIAKLRHQQFGQSSERGATLEQSSQPRSCRAAAVRCLRASAVQLRELQLELLEGGTALRGLAELLMTELGDRVLQLLDLQRAQLRLALRRQPRRTFP